MSQKVFFSLFIPILIITVSAIVVALGRGYRLDFKQKEVKPTGILVATSDPNGAQVFLNEKFKAATNSNLNLEPGWYEVRIHKEGYQDWSKKMRLQGEVVLKTDAVLFPANPSLSLLTTSGVSNPILSPDGTKIAYLATPSAQPATSYQSPVTYLLDLTSRPLPFNKNPKTYEGTLNQLLSQWQLEAEELFQRQLASLPEEFVKIATGSSQILSFSPDETRILYQATASATLAKIIESPLIGTNPTEEVRDLKPDKIYVYDIKEDRNYLIPESEKWDVRSAKWDIDILNSRTLEVGKEKIPPQKPQDIKNSISKTSHFSHLTSNLQWLSTSRHLVLVEANKISIMEYDGANRVIVYSAPFENSFVFPHPASRSLLILTTLNPEASTSQNLYTLSLQ